MTKKPLKINGWYLAMLTCPFQVDISETLKRKFQSE